MEQIEEMGTDLKFFKGKKLDKVRWNLGMETLLYVAHLEKASNNVEKHTSKGLMRTFDLVADLYKLDEIHWKHLLDLKKTMYGKDYIRKCCLYAIFRSYTHDIDIVDTIHGMMQDSKKRRIRDETK